MAYAEHRHGGEGRGGGRGGYREGQNKKRDMH